MKVGRIQTVAKEAIRSVSPKKAKGPSELLAKVRKPLAHENNIVAKRENSTGKGFSYGCCSCCSGNYHLACGIGCR